MLLEYVQVADPGLDKLGADEVPRVVPGLPIGGEDAAAQKILPVLVKRPAFALRMMSAPFFSPSLEQMACPKKEGGERKGGNVHSQRIERLESP